MGEENVLYVCVRAQPSVREGAVAAAASAGLFHHQEN